MKTKPMNIHSHMTGVAKSAGHGTKTMAHKEPSVGGKKVMPSHAAGKKCY